MIECGLIDKNGNLIAIIKFALNFFSIRYK